MRSVRIQHALLMAASACLPCAAQNVISAKAGTLHFFTGQVSLDGVNQYMKVGYFPTLKTGGILRTERGRAEVLLTPGVFLRLTDNTSVQMLDSSLAHTRVAVLSGYAMVESDDPQMSVGNAPVTLTIGETEVKIVKHGLVGINADANQVKVYRGEAEVTASARTVTLKAGRYTETSGELHAEKFDAGNETDDLLAWSRIRSADLSAANLHSAGVMHGGAVYGYTGGPWNGGWYYDPIFGAFTFVPSGGIIWNPWGYGFYSPGTIFGSNGIRSDWFRSVYSAGNGFGKQPPPASRPVGRSPAIIAPPPGWTPRSEFRSAANAMAEVRRVPSPGIAGFRSGGPSGFAGNAGSFRSAANSGSFGTSNAPSPSFGSGGAGAASSGSLGAAGAGRHMGGGGGGGGAPRSAGPR